MIEKTQLGHKKIVLKSLQTTTIQPAYKLTKIINVEFHQFQCKHEDNLAKIIIQKNFGENTDNTV